MALCIHAGRRWHACSWRTGKGKLGAAWRGWNPPDTGRCRSALKTGEHAAWTNENLNFGNTRQCLRVTRPYRGAQRRPYRGAQRKPGPTPRWHERARPPCAGFARRQIGSGSGKRNSRPAAGTVRSTLDGTGYGQRKSSLPVCSDAAVVFMSSRRPQECPRMGFLWSERPIWVHAFGRTSGLAWKAVACLSRVDNQDSHAENGKAGADIVMGSPILSALLRPRHRLHSRKPPMARHASDCTGCQHFDAPHAWSHGALGRTGRGSSDRHVTSSAPLR